MTLDLRLERRRQGMSLEDVADSTRIPLRYLAALEDEDYVVLPPGPFRRGYMRQYLEELGFNPESGELPDELARELAGPAGELTLGDDDGLVPIEATSTTGTIPRSDEIPVLRLVLTGFVLTLVVVLGLRLGGQMLEGNASVAEAAIAVPVQPQTLRVRAVERTRVKLTVDGEIEKDDILEAGKTLNVSGIERIELDAADLTTLVVHHNNERIEPLHNLSRGRRLVFVQDPVE